MTLRNSNECITDERRAEWVELHYTYRGQRGLEEEKQQADRNLRATS